MLETVLMVGLGCSFLGLGCWNMLVHRSISQIRLRHLADQARADAAMQAVAARVAGFEELSALPAPEPLAAQARRASAGTREAQALELAAGGAGHREIAERLSMRPADVELLVKVSAYRARAG